LTVTRNATGSSTTATPARDDGLERSGRLFGGLRGDLRRRWPHYGSDLRAGFHPKVLASALFLFFACLANAIAFGGLAEVMTGGTIGTVEMIVATAVCGVVYALFSAQPLTLLGGTGPMVIFTALLYEACTSYGLPFLPTYAWVGLWAGLLLIVLAITDGSALMSYFTRFTDEIFAALIAVIFIVEAVKDVAVGFRSPEVARDSALLGLVLALGTYAFANGLKHFRRSRYLLSFLREFLADFGPAIAIVAMTSFSRLLPEIAQRTPSVPATVATTASRPWLVDLTAVPTWLVLAAAGPALLATVLLFLDQNITTRLVNAPGHHLQKGSGYHLDLLVVGILVAACSLFGLPWLVAATVHSLNHVRSLAETDVVDGRERIRSVRENRISALVVHLLIGATLFALPLIRLIPMSVLFGLFLYMGFASLAGNQLFERVRLWVTDPKLLPATHYTRKVPRRTISAFTLVQLVALAALWILKSSKLGILFPLLIALLVPLRSLIGRFFSREHLAALDAEHELEDGEDVETATGG
jgi:hypothetical protein